MGREHIDIKRLGICIIGETGEDKIFHVKRELNVLIQRPERKFDKRM